MAVSNSVLMLRTFCYVDSNNGYETFELECLSVVFCGISIKDIRII